MSETSTTTSVRETGRRTIADAEAALRRMREALDASFDATVDLLSSLEGKVLTLGVGKSGLAAQKVAATLRSVGVPAIYLNASDSLHGDLGVVGPEDAALLFSKSGSTHELLVLLPHLRSRRVRLVAIVGTPGSPLATRCDLTLDASVEQEGCPLDCAPMASVLAAQAMGDAVAAAVMQTRGFTSEDFARLHPAGALGARVTLTVGDVMRRGEELPLVTGTATLKEAVLEITRTGFGACCVVDGDRLVGFLTDGDVRRLLLRFDNLAEVRVEDVMTRSPVTLPPDLPLSQALLIFEQRKKAYLTAPVVDGERCVGLLRLHDAVQAHLPEMKAVSVSGSVTVGDGHLALIAGPCVVESRELTVEVAGALREACRSLGVPFIFKASFDKANRTAGSSFRSIGDERALEVLAEVRRELDVPVLTDVHEPRQAAWAAEVVDVLQIPAFLCRQTDLLSAAGATGKVVNVKKGQFMAPDDMRYAVEKVGGGGVLLTERGTTFGYRDLVVDFRGLDVMRRIAPVVFDATHSVQTPGGAGGSSGGHRELVAPLARAAVAFGVDALFLETHPDPDRALSDGPSMLPLREVPSLLETCLAVHALRA